MSFLHGKGPMGEHPFRQHIHTLFDLRTRLFIVLSHSVTIFSTRVLGARNIPYCRQIWFGLQSRGAIGHARSSPEQQAPPDPVEEATG